MDHPHATLDDEDLTAGIPRRITGPLHTDGVHFANASNQHIRLIGVDLANGHTDAATIGANVAGWGMNMVRVVVDWEHLEPTAPTGFPLVHTWDDAYLAEVKAKVDGLTQQGIGVVLDMHQYKWSSVFGGSGMPAWLYPNHMQLDDPQAKCAFFSDRKQPMTPIAPQEGFIAAWNHLLTAFATDPMVVGADLLNEPTGNAHNCPFATFDPEGFYVRVAQAVRANKPDVLLLVEDNAYESFLGTHQFFLSDEFPHKMAAAGLSNWGYSWHFYPNPYAEGQPLLDQHITRASTWNVPLWIGEFNPKVGSTDGSHATPNPHWQSDLTQMMAYFKANPSFRLSWSLWEYEAYTPLGLVDSSTHQPDPILLAGLQSGY
jgi:hypothetical protein